MSHEYRDQLDIKNNEKTNGILNEMPEFVACFYDHMVAKRDCSLPLLKKHEFLALVSS